MRLARLTVFVFVFFCLSTLLPAHSRRITVTGKLTRTENISEETSGWSINLNPVLEFDGQQFSLVEVKYSHPHKLENLDDEFVRATGTLIYTTGPDTGRCPVLALSSIKEVKRTEKLGR